MKKRINDLINSRIFKDGEVIKFASSTDMLRHFMVAKVYVRMEITEMKEELVVSDHYDMTRKEILECCEMLEDAINKAYYSNHLDLSGSADSKKVADEIIELIEKTKDLI